MVSILVRIIVNALALWAAAALLPGIAVGGGTSEKIGTLLVVAIIFGVINAVLKPIIKVFGCPLYLLTLGLFGLVVNALLFMLAGWIAGELGRNFEVAGFWAAFWGAIVMGIVSFLINVIIPDGDRS